MQNAGVRFFRGKIAHLWLRRAFSLTIILGLFWQGVAVPFLFAVGDTKTWNFATPSDYTVSDNSLAEVIGGAAKLKVQEYSDDADTGMLLHVNESSDNPTDSASPTGSPQASNVTYSAGKLNNAANFNGSTSQISVADSANISLNNSHSIETWANLSSAFTANSTYGRLPIFDKGSQQMYFDKDTGELVYEAALANQTTWTHVAGPISSDFPGSEVEGAGGIANGTWDYNGKATVSAIVHIGSNLYVGLGQEYSDAEVWKFDGTTWSMIGGDRLRSSWENEKYEIVSAMAVNGNTLYVGIGSSAALNDGDAEVWSLDVSSDINQWAKIGGDGANSSWNYATSPTTQGPFEIVNALHYTGGALYAGIGNTAAAATNTDAELWRFNGTTWSKVGGDQNQSGYGWSGALLYENVLSITSDATYLYVGMGSTVGDADVWRATLASLAGTPSWSQIGGDGTGWAASTFEEVRALYSQGSYIYAGLGNSAAGDAEVYRWNGSAWTKIGECASTSACTTMGWQNNFYEQVWSIWGNGTLLYVGLGNSGGDNDIWQFNDAGTSATGDDVWTQIGGSAGATDFGTLNLHTHVRTLYHDGTNLYGGLGAANNATGELWKYNDSQYNWSIIGGNYINDSWGYYAISRVESMITGNGKLYVGLGATASGRHGSALVWQYDGSSWTRIGGQGKNGSWNGALAATATAYENVPSMAMFGGKLYVGLGATVSGTIDDGEVWGWEIVSPNTWTKVGGDADIMVAISNDGTGNRVMSSANGTSWTIRSSAADTSWSSVAYGADRFVAVSSSGVTQSVMTSLDGTAWTIRNAASANSWQSVAYGEGLFVAVANSGTGDRVMTSPDGITWTSRTSAADNAWKSVIYGNGLFVAIANSGTGNRVMTSPDGITWTSQTTPADISWNSIAYGNGVFVAVANDGVLGSVMTSSDGSSWTLQNAAAANSWQSVAYGRGTFVAVSSNGSNNRAMTSPDGVTWTIRSTPSGNGSTNTWSSITYHQTLNNYLGIFVAVASSGTSGYRSMYSTNLGQTWTAAATPVNNAWQSIATPTSWSNISDIESAQSMGIHDCPGTNSSQCLYVGLGASTNTDSKVYAYDSSTWQQVGGYGTVGSWEGSPPGIEAINNLRSYKGKLYASTGNNYVSATNGDGELWEYSGTGSAWTKVGGDGVNSSWSYAGITANGSIESVNTTSIYAGDLYVGLGTSSNASDLADAEVWKWSGSGNWTKVGGDGVNSSWDNSQTYESVRSMAVYNGELYVGLGDTSASGFIDSEVWKWNGTTWTIVGGEAANNSSWPDTVTPLKEQVYSMATYNGKLYAGLGNSTGDAAIWSYGGNAVVRTSTTTTQPTGWRHIAAIYDQSAGSNQMKIYIDGIEKGSATVTSAIVDNALPLLIGTEYGTRYQGEKLGFYAGALDEIRFSSVARSASALNLTAYTSRPQAVRINTPHYTSGMKDWTDFDATETVPGEGIKYRLSIDGGTTWKYWNDGSSAWATSAINFATDDEAIILSKVNDKATIDSHINTLSAYQNGIMWQAILNGNGTDQVTLSSVSISGTVDTTDPTNPTLISAFNESGGTSISADTWYSYPSPYFSWSGASDPDSGSGVKGYYVDFEEAVPPVSPATLYTCSGDPETQGDWTITPEYTAGGLTAGKVYCLRIKTKDNAGNVSEALEAFQYRFDNSADVVPDINPIPGFINDASVTFTWASITSSGGAPIQKLQYKTGAGAVTSTDPRGDSYADWQDLAANATSVTIGGTDEADKASYQDGSNTFYLRVIDVAGNIGTPGTEVYNSSGEGPSAPQNLEVSPSTTSENPASDYNFTFEWDPPSTFLGGDSTALKYCYRVKAMPDPSYCNGQFKTARSVTGYIDGMENGMNTFYVVARNSDSSGATVNYQAVAGINFYLQTTEPGPPDDLTIGDISVKSDEIWRLTLAWKEPLLNSAAVDSYSVYRSDDDGLTYSPILTSYKGLAYTEQVPSQKTYSYKIMACDKVSNCSTFSNEASMLPTGKFTEAAALVSGPTASAVTTKKATIKWGTDRTSDSKVQYGTTSGSYFTEEPSNSTQVTDHEITLNNLSAGTTYYYKAKWTDEDGNTGASSEKSFTTEPAPSIKDAVASKIGITNAYINFTSTGSTKIKIYYGETAAFGLVKTISTSTSETSESIELEDLKDNTKYYFKINAVDADNVEYDGTTLSFTTLPRPRISKVRIQQIAGTAQPAILVTWSTNTPVSSIVTFYPTSNPGDARDEVNVELSSGEHQMIVRSLLPKTPYTLIVSGRDKAGNEARSESQSFTTATDTRPPKVSNMKIEGSVSKATSGSNARLTQLIVSWTTDEPATSQVEYGEGTSTSYPQKSQEDAQLKINHLVVISNLPTSRVYHLRAGSKDSAGNIGNSIDTVTITPKGSNDALDLVMTNMLESFGFLKNVIGQ